MWEADFLLYQNIAGNIEEMQRKCEDLLTQLSNGIEKLTQLHEKRGFEIGAAAPPW